MIASIKIQRRCAWSGVRGVCAWSGVSGVSTWSGVWEKSKKMWKVAKSLTRVLSAHSLFRILITMLTTQQKTATLKGNFGDFFLFVQSFYRPKTKTSFNRQFSPKSPKIGKKSCQRVQNSQNKDSTVNSVLRPTVGIHQFCPSSYCGNPFIYSSGFPQ